MKYGVLLAVLVVVCVYGFRTLDHLRDSISNARGLSFETSDPQLFAFEYQRLRSSLGRYVAGEPLTDLDTVMLHFDILWARCETMKDGSFFTVIRDDLLIDRIASDLLTTLSEIEDAVLELQPGDSEVLAGLLEVLDPFDHRFTEHMIKLAGHRAHWAIDYRDGLTKIVADIDGLGLAITILTVVLLTMFGLEAISARAAEHQVRLREEHVRFLAFHDPLTKLANRSMLADRLGAALENARSGSGRPALLTLDLDGFKHINDTFGHDTGDKLLQVVSQRILGAVGEGGLVARLGGDEFAVLISVSPPNRELDRLARKVIDLLEEAIVIEQRELHVSTSIGIARYPEDGAQAAELMRNSDVALYAAKAAGKRTHRNYLPAMGEQVVRRKVVERGLRRALADGLLEVHFQPQIALEHGGVVAVEALCRWNDPELGRVAPEEFVSVAEESGLILELGQWVLSTVASTVSRWPETLGDLSVAINLSPAQFAYGDLVRELRVLAVETGIDLGRLELEITETALMRDTEATVEQLHELRALGVGLSIDDFGKGYSSLSYLRHFPITQLKIDRSFIAEMEKEENTMSVVRGIIGLAASLGVEVVAEGVENEGQAEILRGERCAMVQGELYSAALASAELEQWVGERAACEERFRRSTDNGLAPRSRVPG